MTDRFWRDRALCTGRDTELYHWDNLGSNPKQRAQELCAGCPVTKQCANDAHQHHTTDYVRAGVPLAPADKRTKGTRPGKALSTHCSNGHAMTDDNLHWSTVRGILTRRCLTCRKEAMRRTNEYKKARRAEQRATRESA